MIFGYCMGGAMALGHGLRPPLRRRRLQVRHPRRAACPSSTGSIRAPAGGPGGARLRQGHPVLRAHGGGGGGAAHRAHPAAGARRRARGLHAASTSARSPANAPLSIRGTKTQVRAIFEGITDRHRDEPPPLGLETFNSQDYKEGTHRVPREARAPLGPLAGRRRPGAARCASRSSPPRRSTRSRERHLRRARRLRRRPRGARTRGGASVPACAAPAFTPSTAGSTTRAWRRIRRATRTWWSGAISTAFYGRAVAARPPFVVMLKGHHRGRAPQRARPRCGSSLGVQARWERRNATRADAVLVPSRYSARRRRRRVRRTRLPHQRWCPRPSTSARGRTRLAARRAPAARRARPCSRWAGPTRGSASRSPAGRGAAAVDAFPDLRVRVVGRARNGTRSPGCTPSSRWKATGGAAG